MICRAVILALALVSGADCFQAPSALLKVRSATARSCHTYVMKDGDQPPPIKTKSGLGRTVDEDGKSNVWAVEPRMRVDNSEMDTSNPLIITAGIIGIGAIVAMPLFPILFGAAQNQY
eukprot:CAMPEP_0206042966 /NCGR_PEP_ID=MMETSP1466-20131121/7130_1 /ASSEMBLY_ACC=CAM_ASM_001126 /TAXON_ID=44452 /ORGANISM="Pavlova gyrans, Strain CCMP608" /LENGTH=117 /DNA_ID=CAMNT_0053417701 /DNA_START=40 /DNA_END=393 /DNA_ORIENTATION=-